MQSAELKQEAKESKEAEEAEEAQENQKNQKPKTNFGFRVPAVARRAKAGYSDFGFIQYLLSKEPVKSRGVIYTNDRLPL